MGSYVKIRLLRSEDASENDTVSVPLVDSHKAVHASALVDAVPLGVNQRLRFFDPGFSNTAVTRSRITYIDGANGILRYRGYAIEQLAEKSTFLEVAFLLIHGELPTQEQYHTWCSRIMSHTFVHENLLQFLKSFRYDAHPMGMFISAMSALSTNHKEANPAVTRRDLYDNDEGRRIRNKQLYRILGQVPTIAACCYRHRIGRPYNYPDSTGKLSYTENFLCMLDCLSESTYRPHEGLAKALDVLFIVHADHELNCSTAAMRHLASTRVDPFTSISGAAGALYGPLHGGASEAVVRMLEEIGSVDKIDAFLEEVKARRKLLMGFGHRVYKSYDPRARILKEYSSKVFDIVGRDELCHVAEELEKRALKDEFFVKRCLYPNVDFYSGLMYRAMGFVSIQHSSFFFCETLSKVCNKMCLRIQPLDFYAVLFAIPRCAGWLAHWTEEIDDTDGSRVLAGATHMTRPRQVWTGASFRSIEERTHCEEALHVVPSRASARRRAAEEWSKV